MPNCYFIQLVLCLSLVTRTIHIYKLSLYFIHLVLCLALVTRTIHIYMPNCYFIQLVLCLALVTRITHLMQSRCYPKLSTLMWSDARLWIYELVLGCVGRISCIIMTWVAPAFHQTCSNSSPWNTHHFRRWILAYRQMYISDTLKMFPCRLLLTDWRRR